jgi:hypothetical protein
MVFSWIGIGNIAPPNLFMQLECVIEVARNKRLKKGYWLIFHSIIWVLWKARNEKICKFMSRDCGEIMDEIKVMSWKWNLSRLKEHLWLFYE